MYLHISIFSKNMIFVFLRDLTVCNMQKDIFILLYYYILLLLFLYFCKAMFDKKNYFLK
jgi:hypothetical protein